MEKLDHIPNFDELPELIKQKLEAQVANQKGGTNVRINGTNVTITKGQSNGAGLETAQAAAAEGSKEIAGGPQVIPPEAERPLESLLAAMPPAGLTAQEETAPSPKRWQPKALNARHREIMRRVLEGANYHQIAEEMGLHYGSIMLICTSKLFREELMLLEKAATFNVVQRADDLSNEALDSIKILMRSARSEALRAHCAERILDTAGYSKVEKKLIGIVNAEDVIKELNKRRREALTEGSSGGSD